MVQVRQSLKILDCSTENLEDWAREVQVVREKGREGGRDAGGGGEGFGEVEVGPTLPWKALRLAGGCSWVLLLGAGLWTGPAWAE